MKFDFFTTDDGVKLGYLDQGRGIPVILMAGYSAPATSCPGSVKRVETHKFFLNRRDAKNAEKILTDSANSAPLR